MGRIGRIVAVAAIAGSLLLGGAVPAFADPFPGVSSISRVLATRVLGGTPSDVDYRIVALGTDGARLPFSGTATLTSGASDTEEVSSADGSPALAHFDISGLSVGSAALSAHLVADGDDAATDQQIGLVGLVTGPAFPGAVDTGRVRVDMPDEYGVRLMAATWGCDSVDFDGYSPDCVMNTPTTGDETWQKGFKVTFTWTDPVDANGRPYERCLLSPGISINWTEPNASGGETNAGSSGIQIDVPASWGTYTLPVSGALHPERSIQPGRTTLRQEIQCYTPFSGGRSERTEMDGVLVPDLPPTDPTSVDAEPTGDGSTLAVSAGGAVAQGAAPLEGYDVEVLDAGGAVVATTTLGPDGRTVAPAARRTGIAYRAAAAPPTRSVSGLRPGSYRVRVEAFNAIGRSNPISSTSVRVSAPVPLTAPRHPAIRTVRHGVRVGWSAPARTGGGITRYAVRVSLKGRTVFSRATTARAVTVPALRRGRSYTVTITATARNGRTATVRRTFTVHATSPGR